MRKRELLYPQKFETTILRTACSLGLVRMLVALFRDLTVAYHPVDFTIDLILLLVFLVPLLLTFSKVRLKYYVIPFCFLITAAMPFSWISSGGLDSHNEYQIIGAIFLFGMILTGRWLVFFTGLMIILEIGLIYLWDHHQGLFTGLLKTPSMGGSYFSMMAVATTIVVVYMKHMLHAKRGILEHKRTLLGSKIQELTDKTDKIRKQKGELESINKRLQSEVSMRTEELSKQNQALMDYMDVSLREINAPLNSILNSVAEITHLNDNHEIVRMLADSGIELEESVRKVATTLESDVVKLNRTSA